MINIITVFVITSKNTSQPSPMFSCNQFTKPNICDEPDILRAGLSDVHGDCGAGEPDTNTHHYPAKKFALGLMQK
jgi:hypothetical protein